MKGKVGEALASGLPMVTTSIGAEGMDLEDEKTAMIADSADMFANAIVRTCTDPALHRRLSEGGRAHMQRRWDPASIEQGLLEAFEGLHGLRPRPMSAKDRIALLARGAYEQSGLASGVLRPGSIVSWYVDRVARTFQRQ